MIDDKPEFSLDMDERFAMGCINLLTFLDQVIVYLIIFFGLINIHFYYQEVERNWVLADFSAGIAGCNNFLPVNHPQEYTLQINGAIILLSMRRDIEDGVITQYWHRRSLAMLEVEYF